MTEQHPLCVAQQREVEQTLDRLASRIANGVPEQLMLVGIRRRGVPLAEQLAQRLTTYRDHSVPVREVTVKRYTDELSVIHQTPRLADTVQPDWEGTFVVVDDVLFTGRTLLRVVQWLQTASAGNILAAVLCARNGQEVPVCAHFVGMRFDVGPRGVIDVHTPPYEEDAGVWLSTRPRRT